MRIGVVSMSRALDNDARKSKSIEQEFSTSVATRDVTAALLGDVERICPILEEQAPVAEANRQPSREAYDAMFDAGLFAMLAPQPGA